MSRRFICFVYFCFENNDYIYILRIYPFFHNRLFLDRVEASIGMLDRGCVFKMIHNENFNPFIKIIFRN